jgi:hypothetical protein
MLEKPEMPAAASVSMGPPKGVDADVLGPRSAADTALPTQRRFRHAITL